MKPELGCSYEKLETIRSLIEEKGFRIEKIEFEARNYSFETREAFKNWIDATFRELKTLPKELQEACADRIAHHYLEKTKQSPNKPIYFDSTALEIIGQKIL